MGLKKVMVVVACILCFVVILGGCSPTQLLTLEKFKSTSENQGYDVTVYEEGDMDYKDIKTYASANNKDGNVTLEYVKLDTTTNAYAMYEKVISNMEKSETEFKIIDPKVTAIRYSKISVQDDENFYSLIQLDTTILMAYGPKESKDAISKTVSLMGY